jgi:hypothetical protein
MFSSKTQSFVTEELLLLLLLPLPLPPPLLLKNSGANYTDRAIAAYT